MVLWVMENTTSSTGQRADPEAFVTNLCRGSGGDGWYPQRQAFRHSSTDAETMRRINTPARSDPAGPRADLLRTMKWVSPARPVLATPL
jgi:hypothetical protein